jgi:hypothetical protein
VRVAPDKALAGLPDGPLCRHLCEVAFDAALDLLAQCGAMRPFGVVLDGSGAVHLRVPAASDLPPNRLLGAVEEGLAQEADLLVGGRVDAVDLRNGNGQSHAVRVILHRAGRDSLTAYQLFEMEGGEPQPRQWWVESAGDAQEEV